MVHRKRILGLIALPLAAGMLTLTASPAQAETEAAASHARILRPINFAMLLEMDFGAVVVGAGGGTVTLDPQSGTRDCSTLTCTGSHSVARLVLSGSDATVTVTYDPSFIITGPGLPMTVAPLFPGGSGAQVQLTGGSATIDFGAALTVAAGQMDGAYTGDFTVNVNYN